MAEELRYACVACTCPLRSWGMCEQCSRAWDIGRREERERIEKALIQAAGKRGEMLDLQALDIVRGRSPAPGQGKEEP